MKCFVISLVITLLAIVLAQAHGWVVLTLALAAGLLGWICWQSLRACLDIFQVWALENQGRLNREWTRIDTKAAGAAGGE